MDEVDHRDEGLTEEKKPNTQKETTGEVVDEEESKIQKN